MKGVKALAMCLFCDPCATSLRHKKLPAANINAKCSWVRPLMGSCSLVLNVRFESLSVPGKVLSLSFSRDEEAVRNWRNLDVHRAIQAVAGCTTTAWRLNLTRTSLLPSCRHLHIFEQGHKRQAYRQRFRSVLQFHDTATGIVANDGGDGFHVDDSGAVDLLEVARVELVEKLAQGGAHQ